MIPLKAQAIQTALTGEWDTAITLNLELLKSDPHDIETLNRLAFAFTITGKIKDAKNTYKKVLELDAKNPIALKNLRKLNGTQLNKKGKNHSLVLPNPRQIANMFIEESGKTKVVDLVNVADPKIISLLRTGEPLILCVKRLRIFVLDIHNTYIGVLPDDVGKRLIKFLNGGNVYEAYIKAVENTKITIFIKETKRAKRFNNQPSFSYGIDKTELVLRKQNNSLNNKKEKTELLDDQKDYDEDDGF